MSGTLPKITRGQIQTEAIIIESLLSTAEAMFSGQQESDALIIIEMTRDRASRLQDALDSVNAPEGLE